MNADLCLSELTRMNNTRVGEFKNSKGEIAHSEKDGSDWSLNDWMTALCGEVGEAANILKKIRRGDMTIEEARPLLAHELADALIYLDFVADQAGINLAAATINKWNITSKKIGSPLQLVGKKPGVSPDVAEMELALTQIAADDPHNPGWRKWRAQEALEKVKNYLRDNKEVL